MAIATATMTVEIAAIVAMDVATSTLLALTATAGMIAMVESVAEAATAAAAAAAATTGAHHHQMRPGLVTQVVLELLATHRQLVTTTIVVVLTTKLREKGMITGLSTDFTGVM